MFPALSKWTDAMSVWTKEVIAKPENVDLPSSSAKTTLPRTSISDPPNSVG